MNVEEKYPKGFQGFVLCEQFKDVVASNSNFSKPQYLHQKM